jgi:hypothetical protein
MSRNKQSTPALPTSHLEAIRAHGFEVITYQRKAIQVQPRADEEPRSEWLPEDMVNWEKRQFIRFRTADQGDYRFDGWEPTTGHQFGGRCRTVQDALAWFVWLDQQKARRA